VQGRGLAGGNAVLSKLEKVGSWPFSGSLKLVIVKCEGIVTIIIVIIIVVVDLALSSSTSRGGDGSGGSSSGRIGSCGYIWRWLVAMMACSA
jgi:hypothetical protein